MERFGYMMEGFPELFAFVSVKLEEGRVRDSTHQEKHTSMLQVESSIVPLPLLPVHLLLNRFCLNFCSVSSSYPITSAAF